MGNYPVLAGLAIPLFKLPGFLCLAVTYCPGCSYYFGLQEENPILQDSCCL
jgi:hypothetical protein